MTAGSKSDRAKPRRPAPSRQRDAAGIEVRQLAVTYLRDVLSHGRFLDESIAMAMTDEPIAAMEHRDRAMARLIAASVLRHKGQLDAILTSFLNKPLNQNKGNIWPILLSATAQLLILKTPPHAAINLAVAQCRSDRGAHRFAGLTNAVLRKIAASGAQLFADQDGVKLNTPAWMWQRWSSQYDENTARAIAKANLQEAALDLTPKPITDQKNVADPHEDQTKKLASGFDEKLDKKRGAIVLQTGSIRLKAEGRIEDLAGYEEGTWWVQDAAAALPARLLGKDLTGKRIADLCAAPGGKTAQLIVSGADVIAVDSSTIRLKRLSENLSRLNLTANIVQADASHWRPTEPLDAVLLDAPCTATGTMRRHPDIAHLKSLSDITKLQHTQAKLLANAIACLRQGGLIIYCSCSLEPEEGIDQITTILRQNPKLCRVPITAAEIGADPTWITADGDLRTLPFHLPNSDQALAGMDGFYAARLQLTE